MPVLLCLTGLPGVGKSTIASQVARQTGALWLWVDEIETAMRASHMQTDDLADGGYAAAQAVSRGALRQGFDVIADCVNPISLTREAWRRVSADTGARHLDVEVICSDEQEHRSRVETRKIDIAGWVRPDWRMVQARDFEPLPDAALRLDTARASVSESVARICAAMRNDAQEKADVRDD